MIRRTCPAALLKINTRQGWHAYYVARYNRDQSNTQALEAALWYLILMYFHEELLTLDYDEPTENTSRCPHCGTSGVDFDESPAPSDYCGHDPALVREPALTL